jgi:hypothetical protein
MPSTIHVAVCSLGALAFWTVLGLALSRRLVPATLALPIAPALGWAVHSALALPLHRWIGLTPWMVAAASVAALSGALVLLWSNAANEDRHPAVRVPLLAYALAALIAAIPAMALFPKISGDAVALAGPIFDHSKVALIDDMLRLGVPPGNPFFGEAGHEAPVAYYYLWHFGAAELAVAFGVSAWEADIALAGFTAFASLMLMAGFASWVSGRAAAGLWVMPLAFAASLHPVLELVFGAERFYSIVLPPTGFAGWLFQTTWAPQHVAATSCVLLSCFLLVQLARARSWLTALVLALTTAAGYQSSIWVGGVTFAAAALLITIVLVLDCPPVLRSRFAVALVLTAVIALALTYPFLDAQRISAAARQIAHPIVLSAYPVLNVEISESLRWILDVPAYWLVLLVIEYPAIYIAGVVSLVASLRSKARLEPVHQATKALAALALVSLLIAGCLKITFSHNNDLGWRAVLPGVLVLTICAAAGLSRWLAAPAPILAGGALLLLALGLPRSFQLTVENARGEPSSSGGAFLQSLAMWDAVRRHAAPADRIANNPLHMADMTPWPVNISWALLSRRRSCFAGSELVVPFVALPRERMDEIDAQFRRIFAGEPRPDDIRDLATRYQCRLVVVTSQDGAWRRDPFAASGYYTLIEEQADRWRSYRAR